jgi:hypothetical protein
MPWLWVEEQPRARIDVRPVYEQPNGEYHGSGLQPTCIVAELMWTTESSAVFGFFGFLKNQHIDEFEDGDAAANSKDRRIGAGGISSPGPFFVAAAMHVSEVGQGIQWKLLKTLTATMPRIANSSASEEEAILKVGKRSISHLHSKGQTRGEYADCTPRLKASISQTWSCFTDSKTSFAIGDFVTPRQK